MRIKPARIESARTFNAGNAASLGQKKIFMAHSNRTGGARFKIDITELAGAQSAMRFNEKLHVFGSAYPPPARFILKRQAGRLRLNRNVDLNCSVKPKSSSLFPALLDALRRAYGCYLEGWCRWPESNWRPSHYECAALPTELQRLKLVWAQVPNRQRGGFYHEAATL